MVKVGQSHAACLVHANEILNFKLQGGGVVEKQIGEKKNKNYYFFSFYITSLVKKRYSSIEENRESSMSSTVAPKFDERQCVTSLTSHV